MFRHDMGGLVDPALGEDEAERDRLAEALWQAAVDAGDRPGRLSRTVRPGPVLDAVARPWAGMVTGSTTSVVCGGRRAGTGAPAPHTTRREVPKRHETGGTGLDGWGPVGDHTSCPLAPVEHESPPVDPWTQRARRA